MLKINIVKRYDDFVLEKEWEVDKGEVIVLFGPSGSGKSLTLLSIAGLAKPDEGFIEIDRHMVFHHSRKINIPARNRCVGYVPQNYGLFPHLRVDENISFGMHKKGMEQKNERVMELLIRVGLENKRNKYPHQLSGGEKQRIALLRALANNPKVLLLDEPFSAVDIPVRKILRNEIREFLIQWKIPIVLVTHDPEDLDMLATKMVQYGTDNKSAITSECPVSGATLCGNR